MDNERNNPQDAPQADTEPVKEKAKEKTVSKKAKTDSKAAKTAELEAALAEQKEALLRCMAEFDNYKKRTAREKDALYAEATAAAVKKLLPVLDNLERAAASGGDAQAVKTGIEMTLKQFCDAFAALGVTEIDAEVGSPLDPNFHNAMMRSEDSDLPEGSITEVFAKGYRIGDRVIRHTMVKAN